MKSYNQSDLFQVLCSAASNWKTVPDPALLATYKEKRLARAVKALRSLNVLLYTDGTRRSLNQNAVLTVSTQPAGVRLMIVGYGNNTRYGNTTQGGIAAGVFQEYIEMHRVRVVGPNGKTMRQIMENLVPSQAGAAGEPRYTSVLLPAPFILEANEQISVDLGWDTAAQGVDGLAPWPSLIAPEAFIFYAVKVRDRLVPEDYRTINELRNYIKEHDYQRPVYFNCASLIVNPNVPAAQPIEGISFSAATAGALASADTRPANGPTLITGVGTSLGASKLTIIDSSDGHSFSLHRVMQSSALNMPDSNSLGPGAPAMAPVFTEYFEFPVAHLLKPGATLHADLVLGGNLDVAPGAAVDAQFGNVLIFQGVSV